jgi:UDP-N-acetylglucosamine:LPS N-acetylglucosamine transferase
LHGEKYLRLMASSGGVVCTAGFESISEAAYLGKPLLMIPVENHPEQHVNSTDAELCGLGMRDNHYRLERLLQPAARKLEFDFKSWVNSAEKLAVRAAEITAGWPRKDRTGQSAAEMASAER